MCQAQDWSRHRDACHPPTTDSTSGVATAIAMPKNINHLVSDQNGVNSSSATVAKQHRDESWSLNTNNGNRLGASAETAIVLDDEL